MQCVVLMPATSRNSFFVDHCWIPWNDVHENNRMLFHPKQWLFHRPSSASSIFEHKVEFPAFTRTASGWLQPSYRRWLCHVLTRSLVNLIIFSLQELATETGLANWSGTVFFVRAWAESTKPQIDWTQNSGYLQDPFIMDHNHWPSSLSGVIRETSSWILIYKDSKT